MTSESTHTFIKEKKSYHWTFHIDRNLIQGLFGLYDIMPSCHLLYKSFFFNFLSLFTKFNEMVKALVFKYLPHSPKDDEEFTFYFASVHVIL